MLCSGCLIAALAENKGNAVNYLDSCRRAFGLLRIKAFFWLKRTDHSSSFFLVPLEWMSRQFIGIKKGGASLPMI